MASPLTPGLSVKIHAMVTFFWLSVLGALYSYLAYPLVLLCMPRGHERPTRNLPEPNRLPRLSLIITAHNEADRIADKLSNSLALDYPAEQFEILVASDACSDGTDEIVRSHADKGIRLVRADEHKGKEHAQSLAIDAATGDILVFSDAGTTLETECLRRLELDFRDMAIGAVSSEDKFLSQNGDLVGEGAYVRYEMWLRRLESRVGGLVGLSGSFFAVRKEICHPWNISVPSDFNCALNCVRQGLIAVSDPTVVGIYRDVSDPSREYGRKKRTILRGITALGGSPSALNPARNGVFAFQLFSHKIMRWAVPWFALAVFALTALLMDEHWLFTGLFAFQLIGYLVVTAAHLLPALRENTVIRLAYFFVQVNIATAHALVAYLAGQRALVWEPSKR